MGRRRGFFAELQHQQRLAEQRHRRQHAAAVQAHNRAVREHERAVREYERALAAAERASAIERASALRAAAEAHVVAQKASAEEQTAHASDMFGEIDSILAATLEVDDYVDLDSLRQVAEHPPFGHEDLRKPLPSPKLEESPAEPQFVAPLPLSGLSKVFGKQKHAEATARSYAGWVAQHQQWAQYVHHVLPAKNAKLIQDHALAEQERADQLAAAEAEYRAACDKRQQEVIQANEKLEEFQQGLLHE